MGNASTFQCPHCSGVLSFNAEIGKLECASCGSTFAEGEVEQAIPLDANAKAKKAQHVKTVEQFLDNAPWEVEHEGTAAAATAVRYSCPSCGAEIVADQSTVSTSCPYCGNNMFVAGIANAKNVPQRILPFSVTREQAEVHMHRHFEHKWYLSREFDASVEHMQAVYVPYYLFDVNVDGWADYIAYDEKTSKSSSVKDYYAFKRAGHAAFEKIPIDGSSKMPDAHMDAIAPYDLSEMRDFSTSYAAGYLMEVPDESPKVCQSHAEKLARVTFERDMREDVVSEPRIDGITRVVDHETHVKTADVQSCVLPVWLMHCTWEAEQMLFAINGQTGKCVGNLPVSKVRRWVTVLSLVILLAIVATLLLRALTDGWREMESIGFLVGGAIAVVALVPMAVDSHFMRQMRTAVEAVDAGMSYDSHGLVFTERWRNEGRCKTEEKALRALKAQNASWQEGSSFEHREGSSHES